MTIQEHLTMHKKRIEEALSNDELTYTPRGEYEVFDCVGMDDCAVCPMNLNYGLDNKDECLDQSVQSYSIIQDFMINNMPEEII